MNFQNCKSFTIKDATILDNFLCWEVPLSSLGNFHWSSIQQAPYHVCCWAPCVDLDIRWVLSCWVLVASWEDIEVCLHSWFLPGRPEMKTEQSFSVFPTVVVAVSGPLLSLILGSRQTFFSVVLELSPSLQKQAENWVPLLRNLKMHLRTEE